MSIYRTKKHIAWPEAGLTYLAIVFAAGFIFGVVRVLWVVPQIGIRLSELLEMPLMVLVTVLAAGFAVRRFSIPPVRSARLKMGALALGALLIGELGIGIWLRQESLTAVITARDPWSGAAYVIALVLFGLMPLGVVRRSTMP